MVVHRSLGRDLLSISTSFASSQPFANKAAAEPWRLAYCSLREVCSPRLIPLASEIGTTSGLRNPESEHASRRFLLGSILTAKSTTIDVANQFGVRQEEVLRCRAEAEQNIERLKGCVSSQCAAPSVFEHFFPGILVLILEFWLDFPLPSPHLPINFFCIISQLSFKWSD